MNYKFTLHFSNTEGMIYYAYNLPMLSIATLVTYQGMQIVKALVKLIISIC